MYYKIPSLWFVWLAIINFGLNRCVYIVIIHLLKNITDFWEFLHEYCQEKSETCTKFLTSFVVTKNIKIGFWPAAPVKNRHKMHYHREFTCKRDVTLADPRRKIGCSLGYKYRLWKFLLLIYFILHQLHFHANKVKFNAFLKIHIF